MSDRRDDREGRDLPRGSLEVFAKFAMALAQPYDRDELLQLLLESVNELIEDASSGIMLASGAGDLEFVAASEQGVVEIELHQERVQEGACYEAYRTDTLVAVDDMRTWDAWPDYRQRVLDSGKHAVLGVPMHAFGDKIGVINIYRTTPGPWSEAEVTAAQATAGIAAAAIVHSTDQEEQDQLRHNLELAIESRDTIGQAKGILMEKHGLDSDAAFTQLRERSQHANRKLHEIARQIVDEARQLVDPDRGA
ncbi:MAG: GAF and ANTAR domain-containing protein [Nitriliruptoraceae bacterium]|nr:GAF and ANTAR domain-containing protein [Nitriliruptoraceae bacterium]